MQCKNTTVLRYTYRQQVLMTKRLHTYAISVDGVDTHCVLI